MEILDTTFTTSLMMHITMLIGGSTVDSCLSLR